MRFQYQDISLASDFIARIKPGNYRYFEIRFSGTADTAQTLAAADFGEIYLQRGKKEIQLTTAFLADVGNQYGGYLEQVSNTAGAFSFAFFIPYYLPELPKNALYVGPEDNVIIGVNFGSGMATKIGSNNLTTRISAKESNYPMNYVLRILNADRSAVNGTSNELIHDDNIVKAYINGTYITDIFASVDGDIKYNDSYNMIKAAVSFEKRVESALVSFLELNFVDNYADLANRRVLVEVKTSQSDTVYITYMAVDLIDKGIEQSQKVVNQKIDAKLQSSPDISPAVINRVMVASKSLQ